MRKGRRRVRPRIDTYYVRTYTVLMNLTLSIDERLVQRARKKAGAMGTSLNQLVREYIGKLARSQDIEQVIAEFDALSGKGNSGGLRISREELHERR
jgi:ribosomal 50S subunit-associated protein YjgA (DUF615 family)